MDHSQHLRSEDYTVKTISMSEAHRLVKEFHYSRGGANTATFRHGLFHVSDLDTPLGVAWWMPPTKSAALATYPEDWRAVLALSRLVVSPLVPTNGASFLLGKSEKLIRKDKRWKCLVTYADTWQGHTGAIYKATNWNYIGKTSPGEVWLDPSSGKMVSRKAGPKTRNKSEMLDLGYECLGKFSKHKFIKVL